MSRPIAVLDVDGTLVDSNDSHALACYRALARRAKTSRVAAALADRTGSDTLVTAFGGEELAESTNQ